MSQREKQSSSPAYILFPPEPERGRHGWLGQDRMFRIPAKHPLSLAWLPLDAALQFYVYPALEGCVIQRHQRKPQHVIFTECLAHDVEIGYKYLAC